MNQEIFNEMKQNEVTTYHWSAKEIIVTNNQINE